MGALTVTLFRRDSFVCHTLDGPIIVQTARISGDRVRIAITAPPTVKILRSKLIADDELDRLRNTLDEMHLSARAS